MARTERAANQQYATIRYGALLVNNTTLPSLLLTTPLRCCCYPYRRRPSTLVRRPPSPRNHRFPAQRCHYPFQPRSVYYTRALTHTHTLSLLYTHAHGHGSVQLYILYSTPPPRSAYVHPSTTGLRDVPRPPDPIATVPPAHHTADRLRSGRTVTTPLVRSAAVDGGAHIFVLFEFRTRAAGSALSPPSPRCPKAGPKTAVSPVCRVRR